MAWGVSRVAFKEMLNTVEHISAPNERLRIVSVLSRKISGMDQLQKKRALTQPGNYKKVFEESRQLRLVLDTLRAQYASDSVQLARIQSIKELLAVRDQQFINYLKVREKLVNNKSFTAQVQQLNVLVNKKPEQADSTIVTSTKKTSTTTLFTPETGKSRSFFSKLFGRKKDASSPENAYKIINEENIKRDTIALSTERKVVKGLELSLRNIEKEQQLKSARFVNREAVLANANGLLISQMLEILRKVETEAVAQIELNSIQAREVVNTGINRISIIMLVFFILTILLLYLILTDITRSNRYRRALELARDEAEYHGKAKQRFLSNMSHEIRTPLQSIIGYSELIRQQEHPARKDVEAIHHSAEHLLQIVNEVLDYNRITSGKFTFSNQVFDMPKLLAEVVDVMRPQAEKKSLQMVADFQLEGAAQMEGDPFRLKQILFNLLSNAIKFTERGEVSLSVFYKRRGEQLHFTFRVRDTGIGFTGEEAGYIFNEFEQIESPKKNTLNEAGAGLGLTIVKSLVENQGGRIYVKSEVGTGSSFTVYLQFREVLDRHCEAPLGAEANSAQQGLLGGVEVEIASEAAQPRNDDKRTNSDDKRTNNDEERSGDEVKRPDNDVKIWIVDDDPLILELCGLIFAKNNINFRSFKNPLDVLNSDWDAEVKFVMMDIRMPELSGIELCTKLRPRIPNDVKIYAITAQALPDERALLLEQGFDGLIMKPFREADLLSAILNEGGIASEAAQPRNDDPKARSIDDMRASRNEVGKPDAGDRHCEVTKQSQPALTEEAIELNLSSIEKMTFGDKDQLASILNRFIADSRSDSESLLQQLEARKIEETGLLLHRLAGRIGQMGSGKLAAEFRKLEVEVSATGKVSPIQQEQILKFTDKLELLLKHAENYSIS